MDGENKIWDNFKAEAESRPCKRVQEGDRHSCYNTRFMNLGAYCDGCLLKLFLEEQRIMMVKFRHRLSATMSTLPRKQ